MTLLDQLDEASDDHALALAAGFDPVDDDTWAEAVRSAMKGRGPETLARTTLDGLEIAPLYTGPGPDVGLPGASPHVRGARARRPSWDVHVSVDHHEVDVAAERLAVDVEGGAEGAVVAATIPADAIGRIVGPVADRLRTVILRPRPDGDAAARALLDVAPDTLQVGLGIDPIGALAAHGWLPDEPDRLLTGAYADGRPGTWAITLDATPWSSAGGSDAEVVGLLAAQVVHTLRVLLEADVPADDAVDRLQVLMSLDADQFGGVAMLRALRRLVDRVATLAGASPGHRAVRTDVLMAPRILTRDDPWVNLLRGTVVSFVAGVGGADGALVAPYDFLDPSPLGRRLARTTQLVLREESRLARVDDPAGGSWYVEHRTERLAEAAWEVVQEVDRRGGLLEALTTGWVAQRLGDTREQRDRQLATRRLPLTGVSEFPDLDENRLDGPSPDVTPRPVPGKGAAVTVQRLPVVRFADAYEALRDASDAHLAASGERPRIFLATLGPLAEHTARAGFARNLYAAGGLEAVAGEGAGTPEEAAEAFVASGASIACVCGTDARYEELAGPVVAALRARGAARVDLAGRSKVLGDDLPDGQRPDGDVALGCDVVVALHRAYDALGIAVDRGREGDR